MAKSKSPSTDGDTVEDRPRAKAKRTYRDQGAPKASKPQDANEAKARKWLKEISFSGKREKDFRTDGLKYIKRYRNEEKKRNRYNVLWSNTEVLRPALYNSKPEPDVRRRFRDADPLGKAVGEVIERSLAFMLDGDEVHQALKNDVLDGILPGRGLSRVVYTPKLAQSGSTEPDANEAKEVSADEADPDKPDEGIGGSMPAETGEGSYEQVEYEQVSLQHVDWQDYREGFARTWAEVPWTSYRHKLTKKDAIAKFGEDPLEDVTFTQPLLEDDDRSRFGDSQAQTAKVAEFWEVWDKEGQEVFFVQENAKACLYPLDNPDGTPPLELEGFFPSPDPLVLVENTGSRIPIAMFSLYEDQANELDKISIRIDKIVGAMKLRGIYDSKIPELKDLLTNDDNELTPVANSQQWAASGGLDKAVAWFPIAPAAEALKYLYEARERQKAIIDEIIGISDIVRGATDPDETLGAQQLKSNYYSVRLRRMQDEVKRYACDLIRLAAQVMQQRFESDTFAAMTNLTFPTAEEKNQLQAKAAGIAAQAALAQRPPMPPGPSAPPPPRAPGPMGAPPAAPPGAPGAPPPAAMPMSTPPPQGAGGPGPAPTPPPGAPPHVAGPPPGAPPGPPPGPPPELVAALKVPSWDEIIAMMRSPAMRQFRIDVETDSTIAGTLESDMSGLSQLLKAIGGLMAELAPMVESGALPVDAAKELVLCVIRRARMGTAVEDAFDKMQMPKPKPQPSDGKAAAAQASAQSDQAIANIKAQSEQALQAMKQNAEAQRIQFEEAQETQRNQFREQAETSRKEMLAKWDGFVDIVKATIAATKQADAAVQPTADREVLAGTNA